MSNGKLGILISRSLQASSSQALGEPSRLVRVGLKRFAGSACFSSEAFGNSDELSAARKWLDGLTIDALPKDAFEVSYARSSGPGGQNVNKCVLEQNISWSRVKCIQGEFQGTAASRC